MCEKINSFFFFKKKKKKKKKNVNIFSINFKIILHKNII